MRYLVTILTAWLVLLPVSATAREEGAGAGQTEEEVTVIEKRPEVIQVPSGFGSSRLRNWYVLDSRSLVIELVGGQRYKATLMNHCPGLRFTDTLGFGTSGPFELDRWTTLYLPDGEQCYIRDLVEYHGEEDD